MPVALSILFGSLSLHFWCVQSDVKITAPKYGQDENRLGISNEAKELSPK